MTKTGQTAKRSIEAARVAAAPAGGGRTRVLYLLSGDDGLLLELGPMLGARYRTRPIDSAEQIESAGAAPWALMIDATARTDARAQAARVKQQHPHATLLVICADGATPDWASPLARGVISAVIERGALQSEAFAAALEAADRRMAAASAASDTGVPSPEGEPPRRRSAWLLIAPAVLLTVPTVWYFLNTHMVAPARVSAPPTGATAAVAPDRARTPLAAAVSAPPRTVLELLSDARMAFREEKSLLPPADGSAAGGSALELYSEVLAQDPQNEEARDGLRRLFAVARARIQTDLNAGKLDEASRLLAAFRDAGIAADAIATLEAEIAAARPRWLSTQARAALASGDTETAARLLTQLAAAGADRAVLAELRGAVDSRRTETQLTELASRAHTAIAAGALLEPATDNARTLLRAMQQLGRDHPLTLGAQRELQTALIARAQIATRSAQFELAQQLLNAAENLGGGPELASARKQLQDAIDATRERAAALARAAQAATPAATPAVAEFVHAKPLAPLAVSYPQRAIDAGQRGYVVVEFTLDGRGRASEPKVVESNPLKVFDDAALQAVKRGRYDTSVLGESGQPQRARLRIAFRPAE